MTPQQAPGADWPPEKHGGPRDCADPPDEAFRDVFVALMAGGFGTRFWPLGTAERPKQFLTALAGRPLYVQAAERARRLVPWDRILVLTHETFAGLVREQTPAVPLENIICEPLRRDTAAAVILAALVVERRRPGSIILTMPSDHLIAGADAFRRTMAVAVARARRGGLGTVGVRPTHPATGFGYLRLARRPLELEAVRVEEFKEKPNGRQAERYVASGQYLWNAGMFIWKASALLAAAEKHMSRTYRLLADLAESVGAEGVADRARRTFERIEPISVDYGIMEKAEDVWSVPAIFEWSDVGGWLAAADLIEADANGNHIRGRAVCEDAADNVIVADGEHPVLVAGIRNAVIVHGPGGTLVCDKAWAERIKPLVEKIVASDREQG
ncbi:MAG TPA: sugar phosphate nucleotidyltransferase [Phycisphaerae bacterium]|nr:sugar phosphate nucleotidyltransferase [Phycisphaerae bacterium]